MDLRLPFPHESGQGFVSYWFSFWDGGNSAGVAVQAMANPFQAPELISAAHCQQVPVCLTGRGRHSRIFVSHGGYRPKSQEVRVWRKGSAADPDSRTDGEQKNVPKPSIECPQAHLAVDGMLKYPLSYTCIFLADSCPTLFCLIPSLDSSCTVESPS